MAAVGHSADSERTSWSLPFVLWASFFVGALGAGTLEWLVYSPTFAPGPLLGLWSFAALFAAPPGLLLGALLLAMDRLLGAGWWDAALARIPVKAWWYGFFWLFFLAFVPYPLFSYLGRAAVRITDTDLLVRFSSSASILVLALALAVAAVLAAGSYWLLRRVGLLSLPRSPVLFAACAFPLPWLFIPVAVVLKDAESLAPAARLLYPALAVTLGLLVYGGLRHLRPRLRWALGGATVLISLLLWVLLAAGTTFSVKTLSAAPFASFLYDRVHALADLDGDGETALFDGRDCDEGDPDINDLAYDIPGNGVDENCDGEDAVPREGLVLGDPRPFEFPAAGRYNVLFVMIDAMRADHLHFMGYKRKTSPNLDALAARSLVFTQAVSQYPSTGISVPSMLAGVYPEYMNWGKPKRRNEYRLQEDNVLVTDVLRRNGYHTRALVAAWIKKNIVGLSDHFDHLQPLYPHAEWKRWVEDSSRLSVRQAIKFFESWDGQKPFFLFLHMEDPHEPYVNHPAPGKTFGKRKVDRYDSDIHWADHWFGFLLGYIEQEPWFEDTIIVVVADHGEEFKEHGKGYHGHQIYQESIHVPLIIFAPGLEPQRIEHRVGLVDLFPTLLDLTGIQSDRSRLQGRSLLRTAAEADRPDDRPIFSMLADREKRPTYRNKVVIRGDLKLIRDITHQKEELYNLATDPGEKKNLARRGLLQHEELRRLLDAFLDGSNPSWKMY